MFYFFIVSMTQINYSMHTIVASQAANTLCRSMSGPIIGAVRPIIAQAARNNVNYNYHVGSLKVHQAAPLTDQQFNNSVKNVLRNPNLLKDLDREELDIYKKFVLRQEYTEDIKKFRDAIENEEFERFTFSATVFSLFVVGGCILYRINH